MTMKILLGVAHVVVGCLLGWIRTLTSGSGSGGTAGRLRWHGWFEKAVSTLRPRWHEALGRWKAPYALLSVNCRH